MLRKSVFIYLFLLGIFLLFGCMKTSNLFYFKPVLPSEQTRLSEQLVTSEELGVEWQQISISSAQGSFEPNESNDFLTENAVHILSGHYTANGDKYYLSIMQRLNHYDQPTSWLNNWEFTDDFELTSPKEIIIDVPNSAEYFDARCLQEAPDSGEQAITICQMRQGYEYFIFDVTIYALSTLNVDVLTNILRQISNVSEEKILEITENS